MLGVRHFEPVQVRRFRAGGVQVGRVAIDESLRVPENRRPVVSASFQPGDRVTAEKAIPAVLGGNGDRGRSLSI